MTEQIREHPRARAEIELARGVRMTQHVAAEVRRIQPGRLCVFDKDMANRGRCAQRAKRHLHAHEHVPGRRVRRPPLRR